MASIRCALAFTLALAAMLAGPARAGPPSWGLTCRPVTAAEAMASAGTPNVTHDGAPLPNQPPIPPEIAANPLRLAFATIPRSAQPSLTASQKRILMCRHHLDEANADFDYALFVPKAYEAAKPWPLIVDLHGLNITPLQQMLFDGKADFAEQYGYIVVAPLGRALDGFWGVPRGSKEGVAGAAEKPGAGRAYTANELSELDAMAVLRRMRAAFTVDDARIYLTGHSMGGAGVFWLGFHHPEVWAGLAPISGAYAPTEAEVAAGRNLPVLVMQGGDDRIVRKEISRTAVTRMQAAGMQHLYLEFPGKDHEFWIRRDRENLAKVFLFFNTVSKRTDVGPMSTLTPAPRQP